jgi:SAM-dependent methyltransferase
MAQLTQWSDQATIRRLLSRHLVGRGVELGPGHIPFPLPFPGTQVAYVDRWAPDEHRDLFPELGEDVQFPQTDIVCNLDVDRLKPLDDESQDFLIASHILEHVADPIGILDEIHRVLRRGGTALILLPDRRRTFDVRRAATPLLHLIDEFEAKITEVDDAHIIDFLQNTESDEGWDRFEALPAEARRATIEAQRQRSIHAHCWQEDEFLEVLLYVIGQLGHEWDFVDGVLSDDEGPEGFEFGYVLRRSAVGGLGAEERRQRFAGTWEAWAAERRQSHQRQREAQAEERAVDGEAALYPPPTVRAALRRLVQGAVQRTR